MNETHLYLYLYQVLSMFIGQFWSLNEVLTTCHYIQSKYQYILNIIINSTI